MVDLYSSHSQSECSEETLYWKLLHGGMLCREELEMLFPHRAEALVGSHAHTTTTSHVTLTLLPQDFGPYFSNHPWAFPGHWVGEMAAQAAGLMGMVQLVQKLGPKALDYRNAFLMKTGDWEDRTLSVDQNSPLMALVTPENFELTQPWAYTARVEVATGSVNPPARRYAYWGGIKVRLARKLPR
ncbi:MAG: hypothetical protein NTW50_00085 [Candidatus Berkelbacteria bacterium]|nr:hypothetical protein [Candidatus Berkelbacteria bacterium]